MAAAARDEQRLLNFDGSICDYSVVQRWSRALGLPLGWERDAEAADGEGEQDLAGGEELGHLRT